MDTLDIYKCSLHFKHTYIVLVTEHDRSDDLKDVFSGDLLRQAAGVLLQLLQDGVVHILEYQVQFTFASKNLNIFLWALDLFLIISLLSDLNKIDEMFMSEPLQHPDLSEGNLLNCRIILRLEELFYCNQLKCSKIFRYDNFDNMT